jgi:hypothetical protein
MTANKSFKQQVRARASKTGESYTAALQHFRNAVAMLRHHDTTGACHGAVTPMGRRQRVGCLRNTPPSGRIGCLSIMTRGSAGCLS